MGSEAHEVEKVGRCMGEKRCRPKRRQQGGKGVVPENALQNIAKAQDSATKCRGARVGPKNGEGPPTDIGNCIILANLFHSHHAKGVLNQEAVVVSYVHGGLHQMAKCLLFFKPSVVDLISLL